MRASNKPESEWGAQLEAVAPGIKMAMADDAEKLKAQGVQFNEQLKTILAQLQADKLAGQEANWKSEDERRKKITAKEAAELAIKARKAAGAGSAGGVGGKADESIGPEVATGKPLNQIIPGYGGKDTAIQRRNARSAGIDEIMKQTGISRADAGAELALRNIEYNSGKTTDSKMALMEGTTRQAVKQLDFNVNAVNKEMAKLKSTDALPILNALARGVEKWDGDPAYSSLFYYMNAAATESARILSGGTGSVAQLHQGAMEEAKKWADMNMTPAMWKSVASAMQEEGQARLDTYKEARSSSRLGNTNTGGQSASGPKKIANDADYNALPSGAEFIAPDGSHRKKP